MIRVSDLTLTLLLYATLEKNDLLNGGNGAPIMPEFHRVLANQLDLKKVIFVNIGGVTNITVIDNQKITAGDSSFGNAIVND